MSLSYTMTPFHPTTIYPDQVTIELNLANQNFTTLANIFMNNDPTTLQLKPTVGGNAYANPINLSSQTADYLLEPGQVGVVSFSSQSLVPLNVAVPEPSSPLNPVMYEVIVNVPSATSFSNMPFLLYINNTTYSYVVQDNFIAMSNSTISTLASNLGADQTMICGILPASCVIWYPVWSSNEGAPAFAKATILYSGSAYIPQIFGIMGAQFGISIHNTVWFNNKTSWTSLGSIGFALSSSGAPAPITGFALVRRLS